MQIELLAPLHHPNIVEFLGIVKAKPTYYILTGKRIHVCVLVGDVIYMAKICSPSTDNMYCILEVKEKNLIVDSQGKEKLAGTLWKLTKQGQQINNASCIMLAQKFFQQTYYNQL